MEGGAKFLGKKGPSSGKRRGEGIAKLKKGKKCGSPRGNTYTSTAGSRPRSWIQKNQTKKGVLFSAARVGLFGYNRRILSRRNAVYSTSAKRGGAENHYQKEKLKYTREGDREVWARKKKESGAQFETG